LFYVVGKGKVTKHFENKTKNIDSHSAKIQFRPESTTLKEPMKSNVSTDLAFQLKY